MVIWSISDASASRGPPLHLHRRGEEDQGSAETAEEEPKVGLDVCQLLS